jgi:hypothetical protein
MTVPRAPEHISPPPTPAVPPVWVRAIDLVCLALVIAAGVVAMSGGFRVRVGAARFALTSPYRLLIWAIVIGAVRHLASPKVPIYRDLPRRFNEWRRLAPLQSALGVLVVTRPTILAIGFLAVVMIGHVGGDPPIRVSQNEIVNLQARWDAGWYLSIITNGYTFDPNPRDEHQNIAFMPAYPLIVRAVSIFLGGRITSQMMAGTIVSLAAFFGALAYLYLLARETLDDSGARYASWLLGAYPFAVFFGAIYTESLFLLGAAATFYHFGKSEFGKASLWGLLVGLTRPNGCLLSVPLAILALGSRVPARVAGGPAGQSIRRDSFVTAMATAAMPGIGMLIFSAFIWQLAGDPFAWLKAHAAWGRTYQGLTKLMVERYGWIANAGFTGYVSALPHDFVNALGVLFVLATVWPVARRLGLAYAVFIVINVLPPLAAGGLISMGRLSATMFPSFIWLAGAVPRAHRFGWIAVFAAMQALVAVLFYTWRPLY